jgi:hypothetical protein
MSLRKCEKLRAPNKLKRVGAAAAMGESAVKLFAMLELIQSANYLHA